MIILEDASPIIIIVGMALMTTAISINNTAVNVILDKVTNHIINIRKYKTFI